MSGTILIVDAVATNRLSLRMRLNKARYTVQAVHSIQEALLSQQAGSWDAVILSVETPKDIFSLSALVEKTSAPVLALTQNESAGFRMLALKAGVEDVLLKSGSIDYLLARLRCLIRMRHTRLELNVREDTNRALGFKEPALAFQAKRRAALLVSETRIGQALIEKLATVSVFDVSVLSEEDLFSNDIKLKQFSCFIICQSDLDPRRAANLLLDLRSSSDGRHAAILIATTQGDMNNAVEALDMGANDILFDQYDRSEIIQRLSRQIDQTEIDNRLRATMRAGLDAAVKDPLTGLYNRRYAITHLRHQFEKALLNGNDLSIVMIDLDHFKRINDAFGHAVGDMVLCAVGDILKSALRASDLLARLGGEEFVVILPDTHQKAAIQIAQRLCRLIENIHLEAMPNQVTASIGVSALAKQDDYFSQSDAYENLLMRADKALYAAKRGGRNQVSEYSETAA